jgi:hypothetical protein
MAAAGRRRNTIGGSLTVLNGRFHRHRGGYIVINYV